MLSYMTKVPFVQQIYKDYRAANVSPAGSLKRRKVGFNTVSLDGKPTAFMHVFGMRQKDTEVVELARGSGCLLCRSEYNTLSDETGHLNGKLHRMNSSNHKEWRAYLKHLHPPVVGRRKSGSQKE